MKDAGISFALREPFRNYAGLSLLDYITGICSILMVECSLSLPDNNANVFPLCLFLKFRMLFLFV